MEHKIDVTKLRHDGLPPFEKKKEITVGCINVTHWSPTAQFLACCVAVFILYIIYGYFQEWIFTVESFKHYGWYLTLVQFFFYTIFSYVERFLTQEHSIRRVPIKIYAFLALLTLGTMGFSNSSLGHLNYPTQVIFKCCKLIPVMIGSVLIQKKKYKTTDVIAAILMCAGLSYFALADSIAMISCALLCDAAIGNVQEKYMKEYGASNQEVVLYSYSIGFLYLFAAMLITNTFYEAFIFCNSRPSIYSLAFIFSITGYFGVQVVLTLVRTCGALAAVTVTTCRKAVTIIFSFFFFQKPFSIHYVWAGLIVVLGIYLNLLSKSQTSLSFDKVIYFIRRPFLKRIKTVETTV